MIDQDTERMVIPLDVYLRVRREREKDTAAAVWQAYEREKAMLECMTLTPREYEVAIRNLARRLGV